jgi:hypothetical protein
MPAKHVPYVVRRKQADESPSDAAKGAGKLVAEVTCQDCGVIVCVAQTDDWPPTGTVTLHIGTDWTEPQIVGNSILCGDCGGATTNV